MSKIRELRKLGQSIWYDYIQRSFITSGDLEDLPTLSFGVPSRPATSRQRLI